MRANKSATGRAHGAYEVSSRREQESDAAEYKHCGEHRRQRATKRLPRNPNVPQGFRLHRDICCVAAPQQCLKILPASRECNALRCTALAPAPVAVRTRSFILSPQAARDWRSGVLPDREIMRPPTVPGADNRPSRSF